MFSHRLLWNILIWIPLLSGVSAVGEPLHTLPDPVLKILAAHNMPVDSFSAYVQEVGKDTPLLAVNADVPRNPASTIKLLTTFLALEDLGPTYRWKTEAYLGGDLRNGILDADLYIKGYGDPYLVTERFWLFLRLMRQRGLRHIFGDLVIDDSFFELSAPDPGEFDGQAFRAYNVVPDAFLVNFKAISFAFRPDPIGNRVEIIADPEPANLTIRNQLSLSPNRCGGFQKGINVAISNPPAFDQVTFSGSFGRGCPEYRISRSVLQAPTFAFGVFKSLWQEAGGTLEGGLRSEEIPENLKRFVALDSLPLSDLVRAVNKWSNNVMTRQILLTMGAERFGPPGTAEKGRQAIDLNLRERGLDFPELRIDNGSGLSRDTRISARNLGRLLLTAGNSIYSSEFVSSLALAGLDGTMRRRFRDQELSGRMHLKTGRLDGVFAMAGYVISASGNQYVVVAMQNYTDADRGPGEEAQSTLMKWVYEQ